MTPKDNKIVFNIVSWGEVAETILSCNINLSLFHKSTRQTGLWYCSLAHCVRAPSWIRTSNLVAARQAHLPARPRRHLMITNKMCCIFSPKCWHQYLKFVYFFKFLHFFCENYPGQNHLQAISGCLVEKMLVNSAQKLQTCVTKIDPSTFIV